MEQEKFDLEKEKQDYIDVLNYAVEQGRVSYSMIQDKFHFGIIKVIKILTWMQANKFIENNNGEKEIKVLITKEELSSGKIDLSSSLNLNEEDKEVDRYYIDALRYAVEKGETTISSIQRELKIGFNKAGKIVEWMERNNYISTFDGTKSRKVLLTKDEFKAKYGEA